MPDPQQVELFPRDPRVAIHAVRHAGGGVGPLDGATLQRRVDEWPLTATTPASTATMLATSRWLIILGSVHYELFTVSVAWSLLAVEASMNAVYPTEDGGRSPSFGALVRQSVADGRLDPVWGQRLDAARQLRDGLAHPAEPTLFSPPMALPLVKTAHQAVATLFPEMDG